MHTHGGDECVPMGENDYCFGCDVRTSNVVDDVFCDQINNGFDISYMPLSYPRRECDILPLIAEGTQRTIEE